MAVLNTQGGTTGQVDAPVPGTIDQIYVTPGSFVGARHAGRGDAAARVPDVGTHVRRCRGRQGAACSACPLTSLLEHRRRRASTGCIRGVVTYISPLPLTQQRLVTLLGDRPGLKSPPSRNSGHRPRGGGHLGESAELRHAERLRVDSLAQGSGFDVTPGTLLTVDRCSCRSQSPASIAFSEPVGAGDDRRLPPHRPLAPAPAAPAA